ncbi:MAG: hypothetical protein IJ027_04330 [Oscillospiraceae bacterium]|nr:hypothetical protein [Oscillospiraceae bacterium]
MNKITKEMCVDFLKNYYKSKIIFYLLLVFVAVALWFINQNNLIVGVAAVLLIALMIFLVFKTKHKIDNINLLEFYIVEDVVVGFKKRFRVGKHRDAGYDYIYRFKKHGKYVITKSIYPTIEIPSRKQKHVSSWSADKMSLQSCEEGDVFYLLISKEGNRENIIQSFCKHHFDIAKEDFDYVDEKYYIKE